MPNPPDLVCVGHIVQETIHFPDRVNGPVLGGPPAYCSVAAARQGTRTGVVSVIGPDMNRDLLKPFGEAGVDTTGIGLRGLTTRTELIYDASGKKEIRYPARADPIRALDVPESYRGCRMIYVCVMDADVPVEEMGGIAAMGGMSAVDLGGYGGAHMSRASRQAIGVPADLALSVCEHFAIVKASDEDADAMFGWDDPARSAAELLARGPEVVLVTRGPKGALVATASRLVAVEAFECNAIDTTGAGDTFMAGFLSEYIRTTDPLKAARWGAATAAHAIERTGGVQSGRMPTAREIRDRGGTW